MNSPFDLSGKTALVTGCSKGIGLACARGLAAAGANILGLSRGGEHDEVTKQVEALGRGFHGYRCDLADPDQVRKTITLLLAREEPIDILVNNAGTILRKPAADHPDEYMDTVLQVNLKAQFSLARDLGKAMLERGSGKIIFIASLLSFQGGITVPSYAASKGAIRSLTMSLANEWAGRGINVNAIAPGYIATENTRALREDSVRNSAILDRIPAGRWGNSEDIAGCAVFLASSAADYIHGTTVLVDGGWMGR
jgi:2-deoxy-D-gluconate 3-dehydrogenase